jgi:cell division protein FtsB
MSGNKYLLALWLSIAVYSIASFTIGPRGIFVYRRAAAELERLNANMDELRLINKNLEGTMDALRYDSDTIMVYARELGYGREDERFIRIVGLQNPGKKQNEAGRLLVYAKAETVSDRDLRIVSLIFGVVLLGLLITGEKLKKP